MCICVHMQIVTFHGHNINLCISNLKMNRDTVIHRRIKSTTPHDFSDKQTADNKYLVIKQFCK